MHSTLSTIFLSSILLAPGLIGEEASSKINPGEEPYFGGASTPSPIAGTASAIVTPKAK